MNVLKTFSDYSTMCEKVKTFLKKKIGFTVLSGVNFLFMFLFLLLVTLLLLTWMLTSLAQNSWSFCLCFPNAEITGKYCHTQLQGEPLWNEKLTFNYVYMYMSECGYVRVSAGAKGTRSPGGGVQLVSCLMQWVLGTHHSKCTFNCWSISPAPKTELTECWKI